MGQLAGKLGIKVASKVVFSEKLGSTDKLLPFIGPVSDLIMVLRPKTEVAREPAFS